jgi:hypothetical protein
VAAAATLIKTSPAPKAVAPRLLVARGRRAARVALSTLGASFARIAFIKMFPQGRKEDRLDPLSPSGSAATSPVQTAASTKF